jgi:uncharacterized protein YjiS (DUF1127 family)
MPTQPLNLTSFARSEVSRGEPPRGSYSKTSSTGTPQDRRALATAWAFVCMCARKYHCFMRMRRAAAELNGLSDHALKDIGVARNEIEFRVRLAARRE